MKNTNTSFIKNRWPTLKTFRERAPALPASVSAPRTSASRRMIIRILASLRKVARNANSFVSDAESEAPKTYVISARTQEAVASTNKTSSSSSLSRRPQV